MLRAVALTLAAALLIACGAEDVTWWESTAAGERLYLLNKRTGELFTVQDGELRPISQNLELTWEGPTEPVDHERLARLHSVSDDTWLFNNVMKIHVDTKYRNDEVEVIGTIEPHMKDLSALYQGQVFSIQFKDLSGFGVASIDIERSDLIESVDEKGKGALYSFSKRVPVRAEDWPDAYLPYVTWTNQTGKAVAAWKKANPGDTIKRQEIAAAEREASLARSRAAVWEELNSQFGEREEAEEVTAPEAPDGAAGPEVNSAAPAEEVNSSE